MKRYILVEDDKDEDNGGGAIAMAGLVMGIPGYFIGNQFGHPWIGAIVTAAVGFVLMLKKFKLGCLYGILCIAFCIWLFVR